MPRPPKPKDSDKLEKFFPPELKKKYKKDLKNLTYGDLKRLENALGKQKAYAKKSSNGPRPVCVSWPN